MTFDVDFSLNNRTFNANFGNVVEIGGDSEASYNKGYEDGYEAGKSAGGETVVDYLPFAKTIQFNSLNDFGKADVELNLDSCTTLFSLCKVASAENRNNTVEHLTINCDNPTSINEMLQCSYAFRDLTLKRVTLNFDTANIATWQNAFNCLYALETIDGQPLNLSSATNISNLFNYNNVLKEVRFVEKSIPISIKFTSSPSISDETIQSIIDGLADLTGQTQQTLTVHATVGAKLTDTQKATITAKNWTLVY